jgi:hypothetical protein
MEYEGMYTSKKASTNILRDMDGYVIRYAALLIDVLEVVC